MKNISKNTQEIVDMHLEEMLDKEFDRIQQYSYFDLCVVPSEESCLNEWRKLCSVDSKRTYSSIIHKFHKGLCLANRNGCLCPYDGWEKIKSDKDEFVKLLRNRLTYNETFIRNGIPTEIPLHIYKQGMAVMKVYPEVSYFKPSLAKHLVDKYLSDCKTVIDPFSGYSGRMLGVLACGKNYYGSDLCRFSVEESLDMYDWLKNAGIPGNAEAYIDFADAEEATSSGFDALFTCPPYADIEQWPGVNVDIHTCDEWIDICIANNKCSKYLFVVDDKITKWKNNIVSSIENRSHFGKNNEYVILIDD